MFQNTLNIQILSTMKKKPTFNTDGSFGEKLEKTRKAAGLTQKELASKIGTSQRMISYYENESEHPPAALLPALAKTLRISLDELLGLKSLKAELTPKNTRLWKKLRMMDQLSRKDQKAVIHYIEALTTKQSSQ